ncbi:MAG: hypothetical protein AAF747_04640 [Planctomycetota bacterium]
MLSRSKLVVSLAGSAAVLVALAGCSSGPSATAGPDAGPDEDAVNVGLNALSENGDDGDGAGAGSGLSQADIDAELRAQIAAMEASLAGGDAGTSATADSPDLGVGLSQMAAGDASAGNETTQDDSADSQAEASVSPEQQLAELTADLGSALRAKAEASQQPFADALLAVLLSPADIDDAALAAAWGEVLSPSELETAAAMRGLLADLRTGGGDARAASQALRRIADELDTALGVRIATAELCSEVLGFGQYAKIPGGLFLAGQPNPVLVYAEVERFAHEAASEGGVGHSVRLSKELRLYHAADGRLAWRQPAQRVRETSRNFRRDFYLVTRVDLPRTLTVGSYELRVTIRDEVGGTMDEINVPLGVVADRSAMTSALDR